MQRAAMIATGISVLVVGGLVAIAAPAVATATGALAELVPSTPTAQAEPSLKKQPEEVWHADQEVNAADSGGDDLISVGNGTWFSAEGPGDCATNAAIHPYGPHDPAARLGGELTDMGANAYASGEVGYTEDGRIETYAVASGDTLIGIGQRFCIDYVTVGTYNDVFIGKEMQPGDVLILRP